MTFFINDSEEFPLIKFGSAGEDEMPFPYLNAATVSDFLSYNGVGRWNDLYLPSPYDAASFSELAPYVQSQLNIRGKAEWEALTPLQRKGQTHPSILPFKNRWRGYTFWCAFTPYPNANSTFENPCVCASNDGVNWEVPNGLSNPIIPPPSVSGYNADTHLIYDEASDLIVMFYRIRAENGSTLNEVRAVTSNDGRSWSGPVTVLSGTIGTQDFASPSVYFDKSTNKYRIISHNLDQASWPLERHESSSMLSGYVKISNVVITIPEAGRKWWHSFFVVSGDELIGLITDNNGTQGSAGNVYIAESKDFGESVDAKLLVKTRNFQGVMQQNYRSTLWVEGLINPSVKVMLSSLSMGVSMGECIISPSKKTLAMQKFAEGISGASSIKNPDVIVADDFNRTNSATTLGNDLTGKTWAQLGADILGISDGAAYGTNANNCRAVINSGFAKQDIYFSIRAIVNEVDLYFGYVDANNFYRLNLRSTSGGEFSVSKIVAGASAILGGGFGNLSSTGSIIRILKNGSSIQCYLDGELIHNVKDPTHNGTSIGIRSNGGSTSLIDGVVVFKS